MEVEKYTMDSLSDEQIFAEAVATMTQYLANNQTAEKRFPLGKDGAREIVNYLERYLSKEQIKNAYYRVSVKAKIKQGDKVLLVKEDGKKWDLPGGGIEHGETIAEALKRELKEEIGLSDFEQYDAEPKVFKMIDKTANRPLIFLVFEIKISNDQKFTPASNTEIALCEAGEIDDIVDYSSEYSEYIKNI